MQLVTFDPDVSEKDEDEAVAVALSHLSVLLEEASSIVCLVGAGISTPTGIPDFRGKGHGLYSSASAPLSMQTPSSSQQSNDLPFGSQSRRALFHSSVFSSALTAARHFELCAQLHEQAARIDPTREPATKTHALLGTLKRMGKLRRVYSQNIDGLESSAGLEFVALAGVTPDANADADADADTEGGVVGDVVQLHGSLRAVRCSHCEWVGRWEQTHTDAFLNDREAQDCPACVKRATDRELQSKRQIRLSSFVRPAVLLYDETSPAASRIGEITATDLEANVVDLLLVCGSTIKIPGFKSLVKDFSRAARANGGFAVFVNLEEIGKEWNDVFDYHFLGRCDDVFERAVSDWKSSCPQSFVDVEALEASPAIDEGHSAYPSPEVSSLGGSQPGSNSDEPRPLLKKARPRAEPGANDAASQRKAERRARRRAEKQSRGSL